MKSYKLAAAAVAAASLVAGCSTPIETNKKIDYRNPNASTTTRPLEIPPDLTSVQSDSTYSIPSAGQGNKGATGATGGTSSVLPDVSGAHIERSDNQRWLVVEQPADQAWAVIQEFIKSQGFIVASENPATGIIETEWAENRAKLPQDIVRRTIGRVLDGLYSTGEKDKYRIRLEKGQKPGTTDVFVSHRGMIEVFENNNRDRTIWQPRPADPEMEAEMLALLLQRFNGKSETTPAETAPQAATPQATAAPAAPGKSSSAMLVADNLVVADNFDRAWRRIGLALDRSGFTVVDRDRLHGLYFIRYADPDGTRKNSGWFSSIFSSDKSAQAEEFRLEVTEAGSKTAMRVLDKDGKEDHSDTAKRILQLLSEQLK
ncbi:outer membrane protein assembly factor BamC [Chitinivorax sp. PXF-14]|uniref:outer membrane protein assembly factor BamC n=1 Tax=Chitinivorax sp. PXF-14 TaxID=3230488 RepID=UPI003465B9B5